MKKEDWRNRFQIKNENFYGILLLKMSTDEIADAISMLESGIILEDWTDEFIASIIEAKEKRERGPVTSGDITGGDRSPLALLFRFNDGRDKFICPIFKYDATFEHANRVCNFVCWHF